MRAARQAVTDAQDEAEALRTAIKTLRADMPNWESGARQADVEVERCISSILAPHAEALLAEAEALSRQLAPLRRTLAALFERGPAVADQYDFDRGRKPLAPILEAVRNFFEAASAIDRDRPDPWAEARALLRGDPHVRCPLSARNGLMHPSQNAE